MKLNPSETAPRDGTVILGHFYRAKQLWPAKWSTRSGKWHVAAYGPYGFLSTYAEEDDLTEWVRLPKIDYEGNVT